MSHKPSMNLSLFGDLCWTNGNLTPHRFLHGPVFCFLLSCHLPAATGPKSTVWSHLCTCARTHIHAHPTFRAVVVFNVIFFDLVSKKRCHVLKQHWLMHMSKLSLNKQLESISLSSFLFCLHFLSQAELSWLLIRKHYIIFASLHPMWFLFLVIRGCNGLTWMWMRKEERVYLQSRQHFFCFCLFDGT